MSSYMNTHLDDVKIFDAHAHQIENISHHVALASCSERDWKTQTKEHVYQGYGIHPWWVDTLYSMERLEKKLTETPHSFVGEIGLDRSRKYKPSISKQLDVFIAQLELAQKYRRPVAVHLVQSTQLGLSLLGQYNIQNVFLHGYICSVETLRDIPHYFFGFNSNNIKHPKAHKMIEALPLQQILIESDGNSQRVSLLETAQMIARKKRVSLHKVCVQTTQNARRWLNLL